jgi:hypothetical protein
MSGKYVSNQKDRWLNDPQIFIHRGERVTREAFVKQRAFDNLPAQSAADYGKIIWGRSEGLKDEV